uniref:Uncharacterized protein n=1 Tax=viral metagenome TaxID=1070528 RepID=A0A6M3M327_9ZZZZ
MKILAINIYSDEGELVFEWRSGIMPTFHRLAFFHLWRGWADLVLPDGWADDLPFAYW